MLLTRAEGGRAEGATISAFTGIGRVGFLDTMVITVWEPPHRAVIRHTGKTGPRSGAFEVEAVRPGVSRVVWSEWSTCRSASSAARLAARAPGAPGTDQVLAAAVRAYVEDTE